MCVTGFNTESGNSTTAALTSLVHRHSDCEIWGFSEVQNADVARDLQTAIERAHGGNFRGIVGTTGGADKLVIIFDDVGFDLLLADDVFSLVVPSNLTRTQCSEALSRQFNSVLDFVFVSGEGRQWARSAEILEAQSSYCPDDDQKSDHRPVKAIFEVR